MGRALDGGRRGRSGSKAGPGKPSIDHGREKRKLSASSGSSRPTVDDIVEDLRHRLASQEIPPGAKLLEQELAHKYNVSRARMRDVFNVLELRGLIRRVLNRGAVVSRLELEQVFAIYDVREALEGLCVRLAVQNTAREHWEDLAVRFGAEMERKVALGHIEDYESAYAEMRMRFITAAANPVLTGMLDSITEKTRVIMRRVLILPGRAAKGLKQHQDVLRAMLDGDAAEAERLKRLNIRSAIEDLKRYQQYVF